MIKYLNTQVVCSEVPGQITLAINLTNCWFRCPKCHTKELWKDIGKPLTMTELSRLIYANDGITCVCFMGEGYWDTKYINARARYIKHQFPQLKVALYTGRAIVPTSLDLKAFDFVKVGPYDEKRGPINKPTTNQRMYKVNHDSHNSLEDITYKFWKKV